MLETEPVLSLLPSLLLTLLQTPQQRNDAGAVVCVGAPRSTGAAPNRPGGRAHAVAGAEADGTRAW